MKLKYKKMILLTTMSTMGIGLLTLSLSHDNTSAEENTTKDATVQTVMSEETVVEEETLRTAEAAVTAALEEGLTVTPTPTTAPTPTPIPVYAIEEGGYPKINQLIKDYYSAKNNRDIEAMKGLLSDPSEADTQEALQQKTEYIEDYLNIKAYVKKGYIEGTYIVYAYHEIKFTGINTPAPGLAKFYVTTDSNGDLKIFSGTMTSEEKTYYDERNSDEDVIALIEMTDAKSDEAIKSDEDLLNFWKNIDEMANSNSGAEDNKDTADATAEGDSD